MRRHDNCEKSPRYDIKIMTLCGERFEIKVPIFRPDSDDEYATFNDLKVVISCNDDMKSIIGSNPFSLFMKNKLNEQPLYNEKLHEYLRIRYKNEIYLIVDPLPVPDPEKTESLEDTDNGWNINGLDEDINDGWGQPPPNEQPKSTINLELYTRQDLHKKKQYDRIQKYRKKLYNKANYMKITVKVQDSFATYERTMEVPRYAPISQLRYSIAEHLQIGCKYELYHNKKKLDVYSQENDDIPICDLFEPYSKIILKTDVDTVSHVVREQSTQLKCSSCNDFHWDCNCEVGECGCDGGYGSSCVNGCYYINSGKPHVIRWLKLPDHNIAYSHPSYCKCTLSDFGCDYIRCSYC